VRTGLRRGAVVRRRLAALQAEGFAPKLVCKGDLARGTAWVAFDAEKAEILSEEGVRAHVLSALAPPFIDEARRLGDPNPLYYVVRLQFGAEVADLVTTRRREAERWVAEIAALTAQSRRPSPTASA
jgi:hypothetical protein